MSEAALPLSEDSRDKKPPEHLRLTFGRNVMNFFKYSLAIPFMAMTGAYLAAEHVIATTPEQALIELGADPDIIKAPAFKTSRKVRILHGDRMTLNYFNASLADPGKKIGNKARFNTVSSSAWPDGSGLGTVFFNMAPEKAYSDFHARLPYIDLYRIRELVSAQELALYVLLHELRHIAQPHMLCTEKLPGTEYAPICEADADAQAVTAMEAKNPQTRIRPFILAFRTLRGGYLNGLALRYMLEGKPVPPLQDMLKAHKAFKDLRFRKTGGLYIKYGLDTRRLNGTAIDILTLYEALADESAGKDPLLKDWARLYLKAYETLTPKAMAEAEKLRKAPVLALQWQYGVKNISVTKHKGRKESHNLRAAPAFSARPRRLLPPLY